MAGRRVFVPLTTTLLAEAVERGTLGPAPLRGHAVTALLRAALHDADEEECEYAATTAAAAAAVALLGPADPPLRLVAAVDVAWADDAEDDDDPSAVTLEEPVPLRLLAAVLADSDDARDTVAAAHRDADPASTLDHDLGWYAAQEVPALLDRLTGGVPRSAHGRRHPTAGPGQRAEPDLRPGDPGA